MSSTRDSTESNSNDNDTPTNKIIRPCLSYDQLIETKNDYGPTTTRLHGSDGNLDDDIYKKTINCNQSPLLPTSDPIDHTKLTNTFMYLGEGAYGIIYKAYYNGQEVAVKKIDVFKLNLRRCNKEKEIMEMVTKNNTPSIIEYYGYYYSPPYYHIVMEYMPNGSLDQYIATYNTPPKWVARYPMLGDIALAIDFLHQQDIVHRDIKSPNILLQINPLTHEIQAKLCDFGFATPLDPQGFTTSAGSIEYMAPEALKALLTQLTQKERVPCYTKKSDIYSFAMLIYEIATWGQLYVDIKTTEEIISSVLDKKRLPLPNDCEDKIAHLITWGWAEKPADRPDTKDFVRELSTGLNGRTGRFEK